MTGEVILPLNCACKLVASVIILDVLLLVKFSIIFGVGFTGIPVLKLPKAFSDKDMCTDFLGFNYSFT